MKFQQMKQGYILLLTIAFLLQSCKSQPTRITGAKRDSSITQSNAFSELFVDSTKLEGFLTEQRVHASAANRIRKFYINRNYQFAWFTKEGLAEHTGAFLNLHNSYIQLSHDSMQTDQRFHQQMEFLANEDTTINAANDEITKTELRLTEHFFKYAQYAYGGKVDPEELQWHIRRKKVNVASLLDSLIANKGENSERWEPVNEQYKLMKKELKHYSDMQKRGGWKEIYPGSKKAYKQGDTSVVIKQLKQRLVEVAQYTANDTSNSFTTQLLQAVKQAQKRYGFKQDGIITDAFIADLNVPVKDRIQQLQVNMERMRWMPEEPEGNRIIANIPDFKLHVFENAKKVFDMDIVVGTAANKTVVFNDLLQYIVFSPYWNIPPSIVRKEILPGMRRSAHYLADKNMERTGSSNGLPNIRQKPGGSNSLGRVKFLFPNNYSIYFHDTPSKSLFENEKRAFSHGCIRLAEPKKMATYLLRNQPGWTPERIDAAMNASKESWVTLKEPMPVLITYFTAWVDRDGLLNFRKDVYGNDKKMAQHLFEQH
jgi:murein L,D-transpeptidase YcbB/YkuD